MKTHPDADHLADALRAALEAERPSSNEDAILARAIAGAVAATTAKAATTTSASSSLRAAENEAVSPRVAQLSSRRRTSSRTLRIALPLAATFAASLALAGAVYVARSSDRPKSEPTIPNANAAPSSSAPPQQPHVSSLPPKKEEDPLGLSVHDLPSAAKPSLAAVAPDPAVAMSSSSSPQDGDSAGSTTAADLFRDANAERRAGNIDKAVSLYRSLQKRYPEASETQASRVTLGRLLLDRKGDPSGALEQFDGYLKSASTAPSTADMTLAEEARVGRALSLQRLGRHDDERRAWEELVQHHPGSIHLPRARERINALGAAPGSGSSSP